MQNAQLQKQLREVIDFLCHHGSSIRFLSSGIWVDREWDTPKQSTKPMFEIIYLISGQTSIYLNGITHAVKKNDLHLLEISGNSMGGGGHFQMYYLDFSFDIPALSDQFYGCCKRLSVNPECINLAGLESYFLEMHFENIAEQEFRQQKILCSLQDLFICLYRRCAVSSEHSAGHSGRQQFLYDVLNYLEQNYMYPLCLKDISGLVHLNPRYLSRLFKEATGLTIQQYLIRLRIGKAKKLLSATSHSITDIALETGFCDCQHFCKVFKQLEGITPTQYGRSIPSG
ncbi:AraC family transcriptional regulator [Diplocloster agilis]|uniref:AraC family transcriptional regulator n=1 Tax=Diplocloster agilis TaxID=2850323 RepID=UPI0008219823|nr:MULTISPECIES: AraC family transcriptional regulator [Lachnospiraceae]MBU9744549.1 AraC family transcriptional regulator [Diplocloster agilis]MCU6732282.1 AraC family transcriptional regulator [Suonthocola fibrivorans]SCI39238.1 Uncharacterized HTH-type transcriptional regulator ypdC [uncultured Clostridium sp.]